MISLFPSGFSFWNEDTVEEQKIRKKKLYTNTAIQAENNLLDRISVFKMNSEQKLSFLGGLIDVKGSILPKFKNYLNQQTHNKYHNITGSAEYLSDVKERESNERYTLIFQVSF